MNTFWTTVFSDLRERGRQPYIFIIALAALFLILMLGAILKEFVGSEVFNNYVGPALCGLAFLWLIWVLTSICVAIFRKPEQSKFPGLSSDECAKARSKLRNNASSQRRTFNRPPDTDLKY